MSTFYQIAPYIGFVLWFIAGISVGRNIERRKRRRKGNLTRKEWYVEIKSKQ